MKKSLTKVGEATRQNVRSREGEALKSNNNSNTVSLAKMKRAAVDTTTTSEREGQQQEREGSPKGRLREKEKEGGGERRKASLTVGIVNEGRPHQEARGRGGESVANNSGGSKNNRVRRSGAATVNKKVVNNEEAEERCGSPSLWRKAQILNRAVVSLSPKLKRKSVQVVNAIVVQASQSPGLGGRRAANKNKNNSSSSNMPIISSPSSRRANSSAAASEVVAASTAAGNAAKKPSSPSQGRPLVPRRDFIGDGRRGGLSAAGSIKRNYMRSSSKLLGTNMAGGLTKSASYRHVGSAAAAQSAPLARLSARSRARAQFCAAAARMSAAEMLRKGRMDSRLVRTKVLNSRVS